MAIFSLESCNKQKSEFSSEFQPVYTPEYASGFRILGGEGHKSVIIESISPWQGADSTICSLFVQRNNEEVPKDFNGQVLKGDAKRIIAMSSTHVAILEALGMTGCVVGVSGLKYISNPKLHIAGAQVRDIGYDPGVDYEMIAALNPDLVLLYGVDGASPMEGKLKSLGIPFMYVGDYLEESPLGKAEWMVAIAEATGNRKHGEEVFAPIPKRYNDLKIRVLASSQMGPRVMLNTPYGDAWFMPPKGSYMVRLIEDAGGSYVYTENDTRTSVSVDLEQAYKLASEADVWLNVGAPESLDDLRKACPKFADVPAFLNGRVYNNTAKSTPAGGNDFFETAMVQPDVVLADMIRIFHPDIVLPGEMVYYRQLK